MIRIVLNRRDVSGQSCRRHASFSAREILAHVLLDIQRDYYCREGWPLLAVVTEVNGDSKSTYERGPFLVGSLGLSCWYKRFLFCFGWSSQPSTKMFFLAIHYFNSFVPIAQQAGQAGVLGRLVCASGDIFNKTKAYFVMLWHLLTANPVNFWRISIIWKIENLL